MFAWTQVYDPLGMSWLSTLVAATPIVALLGVIGLGWMRIHWSAVLGLAVALAAALGVYRMPPASAFSAAWYGAAYGLFPIGWIVLNLIFLYQLTVERGLFDVLRRHLATLAPDPRVQVILIAFSFGAFFEGAAGFGTPVAVTSAILIQLGFKPLQACGLSLIANTAPVAFGALGTPIITLAKITGLDEFQLGAMAGRQLPFFSLLVPFWIVWAMSGWRKMLEVWPAALVAGVAFAVPQYLVSNFHGPWLVDIVASVCSMAALALLLRVWRPKGDVPPVSERIPRSLLTQAWLPWAILSSVVFLWGLPRMKSALNEISAPKFAVPFLHNEVYRGRELASADTVPEEEYKSALKRLNPNEALNLKRAAEPAEFTLNWLSATGTGIFVAAMIIGLLLRFKPGEFLRLYGQTIHKVRYSLVTIAAMLALGYVTKYSGADATLGLALAKTGVLYPFFGTMLGWLGVALTGSDTASNVLFGGLQRITAEQTGISPVLMCAANSTGGVMGKMIDAQSIVVASTATNWYGHEGSILRYVFFHSIALASLMGVLVTLQAYVPPFTKMVLP